MATPAKQPRKENNVMTDFSLIAARLLTGPYSLCVTCRRQAHVQDRGELGCTLTINFCPDCRANNKNAGYQLRYRKPEEDEVQEVQQTTSTAAEQKSASSADDKSEA
jgi:hypothetical protein